MNVRLIVVTDSSGVTYVSEVGMDRPDPKVGEFYKMPEAFRLVADFIPEQHPEIEGAVVFKPIIQIFPVDPTLYNGVSLNVNVSSWYYPGLESKLGKIFLEQKARARGLEVPSGMVR